MKMKRKKRWISILLAICMLAGMSPPVTASGTQSKALNTAQTYIYDFLASKPADVSGTLQVFEAFKSFTGGELDENGYFIKDGSAPWKPLEPDPCALYIAGTSYGMFLQCSNADPYKHQFLIQVPESGEYNCLLDNERQFMSYYGTVTLQPCDESGAATGEEITLQRINLYSKDTYREKTYFGSARLEAGYYVLGMQTEYYSRDQKKLMVNSLILQGVAIDLGENIPESAQLAVGQSLQIPLTPTLNGGMEESSLGDVSYDVTTDADGVVSAAVNNGVLEVTGTGSGTVQLTVSAHDGVYQGSRTIALKVVQLDSLELQIADMSVPAWSVTAKPLTAALNGEPFDLSTLEMSVESQDTYVADAYIRAGSEGKELVISGKRAGATSLTLRAAISDQAYIEKTIRIETTQSDTHNTAMRYTYDFLASKPADVNGTLQVFEAFKSFTSGELDEDGYFIKDGSAPWKPLEADPCALYIAGTSYGMFLQCSTADPYKHQFLIQVPESGEYDCLLDNERQFMSYYGTVTLQPCDESGAANGEEITLDRMNLYSQQTYREETYFGSAHLEAGHYILGIQTEYASRDQKKLMVNSLILQGVSVIPSAQLPETAAIAVGETLEIPLSAALSNAAAEALAGDVAYTAQSNRAEIATARVEGQSLTLTGVREGAAEILIGAQNDQYQGGAALIVQVVSPDALALEGAEDIVSLIEGKTAEETLTATLADTHISLKGAAVTVESSQPSVASGEVLVDSDGGIVVIISAQGPGSAKLTVSAALSGQVAAKKEISVQVAADIAPEDKRNTTNSYVYDFLGAYPSGFTGNIQIYDTVKDWFVSDAEGAAPWKAIQPDANALWIPDTHYGAFMQGSATHTFMIQVPESGEYNCVLKNERCWSSTFVRIGLQPCDRDGNPTGDEISLDRIDLQLGSQSEGWVWTTDYTDFGAARLEEGYYLLNFHTEYVNREKQKIFVSQFILNGVALVPGAQLPKTAAVAVGEILEVPLTAVLEGGLEESQVGTVEYLSVSSDNGEVLAAVQGENQTLKLTGIAEGSAVVTIKARDEVYQGTGQIAVRVVPAGSFTVEGDSAVSMKMGASTSAVFTGELMGETIDLTGASVTAQIQDPAVCSVESQTGPEGVTVQVNGTKTGSTVVTLSIALSGELAVERKLTVNVSQGDLKLAADDLHISLGGESRATVNATDGGQAIGSASLNVVAVSANPEIAAVQVVTENDQAVLSVQGLAAGETTITVQATLGERSAQCTIAVIVSRGKTASSFYTPEKIAAARENTQTYSWAREARDSAVASAEQYINQEEWLWNLVTTQELPRGIAVGYLQDPDMYKCRLCGENLQPQYGNYPWLYDVVADPWKIQCPECRRKFPSNDFGSFYKLGIDENGNFNYELAKQKNQELVDAGQDGYLKNILHPDADVKFGVENWGVDDGYGYKTGKTYSSTFGVLEESHTYIAYYVHWALWASGGALTKAADALKHAYLYTGDKRYGRAGAVLIRPHCGCVSGYVYPPVFPGFPPFECFKA